MRRVAVTVLATLAAGGALPASAPAGEIKINRSIAGIAPGMTVAEVVERLGPPTTDGRVNGTRGLSWPRQGIAVSTYAGTNDVYTISVTSRRHRTAKGIGVGSTRRALRRAHPAVRCSRWVCAIGRFPARRTSFGFDERGRRVVGVSLLGPRRF